MVVTSNTSTKLASFRTKFRAHVKAGTRPYQSDETPPPEWTTNALIEAMTPRLGVSVPSPVAVRKWFREDVVPRELYIDAILDAFFGEDPKHTAERKAFHVLWEAARGETQRGPGRRDDDDPHDIDPSASSDDWIVSDARHMSQGLAALLIHPPPPGNIPNTFQLRVSLSIALYPDEIEDQPIRIGLKQAWIVPNYKGCTPIERHEHAETLKEAGLNDSVLGPRSDEGLLDGVALRNVTLATMSYNRNEPPEVTLELHSRKADLEVLNDDDARAVSPNKQKALQRFLQDCLIENKQGRVVWSHASLKRRGDDAPHG